MFWYYFEDIHFYVDITRECPTCKADYYNEWSDYSNCNHRETYYCRNCGTLVEYDSSNKYEIYFMITVPETTYNDLRGLIK